ncbi:hypothetical protein PPERSA_00760 [Pseudocohnilembus persalinus]|uniref:RING-type domain-containing protein n=1 Tax=Pseudocohnilembus persalinus TaxID=266149 RepID=A0A0V0Q9R6_PSEPJ|nr:hypothetical protein PPERSA_00760 [Pseudocohnilembus persalinus]|eukprot:KRW98933.1 hypothetical protein PPERSA_00760 [Pseudocohnilembus persalinus]
MLKKYCDLKFIKSIIQQFENDDDYKKIKQEISSLNKSEKQNQSYKQKQENQFSKQITVDQNRENLQPQQQEQQHIQIHQNLETNINLNNQNKTICNKKQNQDFQSIEIKTSKKSKINKKNVIKKPKKQIPSQASNYSGLGIDQQCVICLDKFIDKEKIVQLKCHKKHIFHINCIQSWLQNNNYCPLCKFKFENFDINDLKKILKPSFQKTDFYNFFIACKIYKKYDTILKNPHKKFDFIYFFTKALI